MLAAILSVLLVLTCLAMIGLILIQRGKGGGLAGAFGGGGVEQAFGTHAASMAQKATAFLGVIFLILTVILGIEFGGTKKTNAIEASVPAAPASSAPASSAPTAPAAPAAPAAPVAPEAK